MNNRNVFIKKLIYRSKYTGTRETDILLGNFAENHLKNLDDENLIAYQALLNSGDPRIWRLSIDIEKSETSKENFLIDLIKEFNRCFKKNYSLKSGHLIFGFWLQRLIRICYDRYQLLNDVYEKSFSFASSADNDGVNLRVQPTALNLI